MRASETTSSTTVTIAPDPYATEQPLKAAVLAHNSAGNGPTSAHVQLR
ncbi:hypothetical protein [Saccharothrix sp. ALI-22-I]|nr:hypothetical protein [Saccharothrix sp. ALI-22-I]